MQLRSFIKFWPAILLMAIALPTKPASAQITAAPAQTAVPRPASALPGETVYDYNMRLGYAASKQGDYAEALVYFRNALYVRPSDRLATIAYWNMADQMEKAPAVRATAANSQPQTTARSDYERYMNLGYQATENRNYQTALINFRRALAERPNNPYALQAIRNVETYIQRGVQAEAPRLQLQRTLEGEDIIR